jgi:hypothetical protein
MAARKWVWLLMLSGLFFGGCESLSPLVGGKDDDVIKIRRVVVERAPFYNSYPGARSIPFIYLTGGTSVQFIKIKDGQSKVKLANGSSGWVPTAALGETVSGRAGDLAAPESQPTEGAMRDRGSGAVRYKRGDKSLQPFNRTTGVW